MQDKTPTPTRDGNRPAAQLLSDSANVAEMLREMASLLDAQGGNHYRAAAFRKAADSIAGVNLREIFARDGLAGLDALPAIGPSIAAAIAEMLTRGRWSRLDRLRGDAEPEVLFCSIPGVGPELARSLHENLGVDTLEALELAASDGRLELQVPRIGVRRAAAIRASLAQMLDRNRALRRRPLPAASAPVINPSAILSLTDPPGFCISSLASTRACSACLGSARRIRTSGVSQMVSRKVMSPSSSGSASAQRERDLSLTAGVGLIPSSQPLTGLV